MGAAKMNGVKWRYLFRPRVRGYGPMRIKGNQVSTVPVLVGLYVGDIVNNPDEIVAYPDDIANVTDKYLLSRNEDRRQEGMQVLLGWVAFQGSQLEEKILGAEPRGFSTTTGDLIRDIVPGI